jgi:hypothetical protein
MTPEQKARVSIDALLVAAGWHVCGVAGANIRASTGFAIREFPLNPGVGFADFLAYVNGKACGGIEAKKQGAVRVIHPVQMPLLPRAERARIVSEVGRHMSIFCAVEADANLQRAQAQRKTTLMEGFSC